MSHIFDGLSHSEDYLDVMPADNEYFKEASNTMYNLNSDSEIREHARSREEYYRALNTRDSKIKQHILL